MSGAPVLANAAKAPFMVNQDRPGGASALATSSDPDALQFAIATGNRQTRRLARQNLARLERKAARSR